MFWEEIKHSDTVTVLRAALSGEREGHRQRNNDETIRWDSDGTGMLPRALKGGWGHQKGRDTRRDVRRHHMLKALAPCNCCLSAYRVLDLREREPQTQTIPRATRGS